MSKLSLNDLVNLQNENTAVSTINTNNARIEAALEKTLSRDGTSPNQMTAVLDMNSNSIINLPDPTHNDEPVTLGYFVSRIVGDEPVTVVSSFGNTLYFETFASAQGSTIDSTITYLYLKGYYSAGDGGGAKYVKVNSSPYHLTTADGKHWRLDEREFDIRMFGARCDGSTDDKNAINAADAAAAIAGVDVVFPGGFIAVSGGLTPSQNARWRGAGAEKTTLYGLDPNLTLIDTTQLDVRLEHFRILFAVVRSSMAKTIDFHTSLPYGGSLRIKCVRIYLGGEGIRVSGFNPVFYFDELDITQSVAGSVNAQINESFIGTFANCVFSETGGIPFSHFSISNCTGQIQFINVNVFGASHGMFITPGTGQVVTLIKALQLYLDSCTVDCLRIAPTSGGIVERCKFTQGWFAGSTGTNAPIVIDGSAAVVVDQIDIINNDISVTVNSNSAIGVNTVSWFICQANNFIINGTGNSAMSITNSTWGEISANKFTTNHLTPVFLTGTSGSYCIHDNMFASLSGTYIADSSSGGNNKIHDNAPHN